jgi:hypothetical protein
MMFSAHSIHSNRALLAYGIRAHGEKGVSAPNCGKGISVWPPYVASCAKVNRRGKEQTRAGRDLRVM